MSSIDPQQTNQARITRRRVVKTGIKLAYAAPIVAASFQVSQRAADAWGECKATWVGAANKVKCRCAATGNSDKWKKYSYDVKNCACVSCDPAVTGCTPIKYKAPLRAHYDGNGGYVCKDEKCQVVTCKPVVKYCGSPCGQIVSL